MVTYADMMVYCMYLALILSAKVTYTDTATVSLFLHHGLLSQDFPN